MSARGFIGAGDVFMQPIVGGVLGDRVGPFEATKFEIKPNVELKEQVSKGKSTYGQVIESVALQQPADFTVDFAEVNKATIAPALLGTTAAFSQASGTLTDEALTLKHDVWTPASKVKLTGTAGGTMVLTNTAGDTTFVEGVDYIVNRDMGWVKALSTGSITNNQSTELSTPYGAVSATDIKGATQADMRVRFYFDGKNQVDGLPAQVFVYEVVIAADSAFDFLADEFNTISLPGRMKTPAGYTEPFLVRLHNAA